MKTRVSQAYSEPDNWYPLSLKFQKWLGAEIEQIANRASSDLLYDKDWTLIVWIDASSSQRKGEVNGPTIYERGKSVEFTVILPFFSDLSLNEDYIRMFEILITCLDEILLSCGTSIRSNQERLLNSFIRDPEMISDW